MKAHQGMSRMFVAMRKKPNKRRDVFGVPEGVDSSGEAWRIVFEFGDGRTAATLIGFPRKRDAECAMKALQKAGVTDIATMTAMPFEERCRVMLESLPW